MKLYFCSDNCKAVICIRKKFAGSVNLNRIQGECLHERNLRDFIIVNISIETLWGSHNKNCNGASFIVFNYCSKLKAAKFLKIFASVQLT